MLGLGSAFAIPSVDAKSLHSQKVDIQSERQSVQSNISKAEKELTVVLEELAKLNAQIKRVDQAIIDNNNQIVKTKEDIISTNEEIEKLKAEIAVIQERIEKRNEILKQRAQAYQENGSTIGYIEVLLGATNFSDFIERVGAVSTIMNADQDIIKQHDADKKELEMKQQSVEKKLADLEDMKLELEGIRATMEEQKQQNEELKKQLQVKQDEIASLKANLKMEDSTLAAKERAIQNKIEQSLRAQQAQKTLPVSGSGTQTVTKPANSYKDPGFTNNVTSSTGDFNTIISSGYRYFGNSVYVFGAGRTQSDIASGRFDCSGFVSWAFAQGGIQLPTSTAGMRTQGTRTSYNNIQPGDLVFFDTYKKDGHVGIYIGGGKFIGSQSSTGVAIANMTSGYWKSHFSGHVRRI